MYASKFRNTRRLFIFPLLEFVASTVSQKEGKKERKKERKGKKISIGKEEVKLNSRMT